MQTGQARQSLLGMELKRLAFVDVRQVLYLNALATIVKSSAVDDDARLQEAGKGSKDSPSPDGHHSSVPRSPQVRSLTELTQDGDAVHDTGRWPTPWLCASYNY